MKKGFLLTALGAACWGFSGTCGQFLFMQAHISSSYLTTMRMLIAGGVLMIITFINSREMLKRLIQNKRDLLQLFFCHWRFSFFAVDISDRYFLFECGHGYGFTVFISNFTRYFDLP